MDPVLSGMSSRLHLLQRLPMFLDGERTTLEVWLRRCRLWQRQGTLYGSWARQRPRRVDELKGGSVYFVYRNHTMFRMPFVGVEPVREFTTRYDPFFENHFAIMCSPHHVAVEPRPVRFLRGWRYLEGRDAPPDLAGGVHHDGGLPESLRRELHDLGLWTGP